MPAAGGLRNQENYQDQVELKHLWELPPTKADTGLWAESSWKGQRTDHYNRTHPPKVISSEAKNIIPIPSAAEAYAQQPPLVFLRGLLRKLSTYLSFC